MNNCERKGIIVAVRSFHGIVRVEKGRCGPVLVRQLTRFLLMKKKKKNRIFMACSFLWPACGAGVVRVLSLSC